MGQRKPFSQTLIDHVDRSRGPDACWPWTGGLLKRGYGRATQTLEYKSHGVRKRKRWRAHRAYLVFIEGIEVPDEAYVCHTCDNPPCCNPKHLVVADAKWNVDDMLRKGRARPLKGSAQPKSKLTERQVSEIKRELAANRMSRPEVVDRYKINASSVRKIAYGESWKHVKPKGPVGTLVAKAQLTDRERELRADIRTYGMGVIAFNLGVTVKILRLVAYPLAEGHYYEE